LGRWNQSYFNLSISNIIQYFAILTVAFHDMPALIGFFLILVIFSQLISGTMLAFSVVPEPMLVPVVRDEEDLEDLYTDDMFWLHERGVDLLFVFFWAHLFRKLYIQAYEYEHDTAWKTGVFTFLVFQAVTFLGLVICCTHLSEITLTIAANIVNTFFFFTGKVYWWLFTDKNLNTDTLIRLAYAHYIAAFFVAYMSVLHGIDMHYDWKNEVSYDGVDNEMAWWDEALSNELGTFIDMLIILFFVCLYLYPEPEALSYELFMWGDVGFVTDVRFYGVAPHWYFRPFMAWLIVCPHHTLGIFGLVYFFWVLFHQPTLHGYKEASGVLYKTSFLSWIVLRKPIFYPQKYTNTELNLYTQLTFWLFFMCMMYASSFLPYGRFYNRVNGNVGMLGSYFYIFFYWTFSWLRRPFWYDLYRYNLQNRVFYFKHGIIPTELTNRHSAEWLKERSSWHNISLKDQDKMYALMDTIIIPNFKKTVYFSVWFVKEVYKKIFNFFNFFAIKIKKFLKKKI
jgi:quinol-cytochrome oxidoreductase complex cytochrome b subunit